MTDQPRVLIVEDDTSLRTFLADHLAADGFVALQAETMEEGLRMLEHRCPDLALVDVALPDGSGLDLVDRIRGADRTSARVDPGIPIVVLTGLGGEIDRVRGFEKGADDYVVKPFAYSELRLRLLALLRRTRPRRGRMRIGPLEIDPLAREVRLHGEPVDLSQKEFALLRALAGEPSRVFTKYELLRDVWGFRSPGSTRTLDSHACRLRRKLNAAGDDFVLNIWGVGYRLAAPPTPGERPRALTPAELARAALRDVESAEVRMRAVVPAEEAVR